jgi:hypothetical protein
MSRESAEKASSSVLLKALVLVLIYVLGKWKVKSNGTIIRHHNRKRERKKNNKKTRHKKQKNEFFSHFGFKRLFAVSTR